MERESYARLGDSEKILNNKIRRCPSPLFSGMNNLSLDTGPRKRASSFKKPKKPIPDEFDEGLRPRTSSMPTRNSYKKPSLYMTRVEPTRYNLHSDTDFYMCRHFETTSKGVIVNRGDSLRSRSTNSVVSSGSEVFSLSHSSRTSSSLSHESLESVCAQDVITPYRILVTGSLGVGKTGLTQQFMTSEYLGGFDTSQDGEEVKTVSILLDGEESSLFFIDHSGPQPVEERGTVDAYLIVYAVDDRKSFEEAVDLLYHLRKELNFKDTIILVGNKTDLVRSRCITKEEGKEIAKTYGCKFKETSNVLNHNVDQVLCGIVKQIRLLKATDHLSSSEQSQDKGCVSKSKSLLNKIFKKDVSSKSCENLNVL